MAYVAATYPGVTFIQDEITSLDDRGAEVLRIALNPARDEQVLTDRDASERARTLYVKGSSPARIAKVVLATAVAHPVAFVGGVVRALRAGRTRSGVAVRPLLQFVEALLVWDHCRRHGVRALHAHFAQAPATVAWMAAEMGNAVGGPRWTWGMTIHGPHDFFNEHADLLEVKLARADLVVCISHYTRAQVLRLVRPADREKIRLVLCGIDLERFTEREPRPVASPPVVVTTARLSPEKGHLVLLDAVRQLADEGFEVSVRLIGDGPLRDELRDRIEAMDLSSRVVLTGPLPPERVAAELRAADLFCLPSAAEGLPISIMEAMAVGVPVLSTYVAGIPELLVDDQTGWIVPAGSVDALATGIRTALGSSRRPDVIAAGRRAVEARHDLRASIDELKAQFEAHQR